jgi:membrane protease YdiL (CAAX protease family)
MRYQTALMPVRQHLPPSHRVGDPMWGDYRKVAHSNATRNLRRAASAFMHGAGSGIQGADMAARTGLALLICGALLAWEVIVPNVVAVLSPQASELALYAIDKLGFALVLTQALTTRRWWWRCGFADGLKADAFGLLWPVWLLTALSAVQGFAVTSALGIAGWLAVSAAVGFGEEGVFRGLLITVLASGNPRRAVALSSILFGLLHLAGLLGGADIRFVLAQVVAAASLGLVLGCVRLLARSIWPGIIAHTALDFFGLTAAGGVADAMDFSIGTLVVLLGGAMISLAWGAVLWRRLPSSA